MNGLIGGMIQMMGQHHGIFLFNFGAASKSVGFVSISFSTTRYLKKAFNPDNIRAWEVRSNPSSLSQ